MYDNLDWYVENSFIEPRIGSTEIGHINLTPIKNISYMNW